MIERVQLVAVFVSLLLFLAVMELVRRRKLVEEYAFLWIGVSLVLLGVSAKRDALDVAARWLGVYYPPAVLVLLLVVAVFVAALSFSVVVSRQRQQIDRLIEDAAVLAAEIRDLRVEHARSPAAGVAGSRQPDVSGPNRPDA